MSEHIYIVAYDIADQKRWRRVFRLLKDHGEWLQLSVFQCQMNKKRHAELIGLLDGVIHHDSDHILIMDIGVADQIDPQIISLGKTFSALSKEPVIV